LDYLPMKIFGIWYFIFSNLCIRLKIVSGKILTQKPENEGKLLSNYPERLWCI